MPPATVVPVAPAALAAALRGQLRLRGNPAHARRLHALIKGETSVLGVGVPDLIRVIDSTTAHPAHRLNRRRDWELAILALWETCAVREERYAAVGIMWHPLYRGWAAEPASMGLYRRLMRDRPWWDYVDAVATRGVGAALAANPDTESPVIRSWALHDDRWLRRAAIVCQQRRRGGTDRSLLLQTIVPNLDDRSPVVRTAIGQALVSYARSGPPALQWVHDTLATLGSRVPRPLSSTITRRIGPPAADPPSVATTA